MTGSSAGSRPTPVPIPESAAHLVSRTTGKGDKTMVVHDVLPLSLSLHRERGWSVLDVSGQVSLNTRAELARHLGQLAAAAPARVIVDVSEVAVCDAMGLGALWAAYEKAARQPGGELRLVCGKGHLLHILCVSGVSRAVPVFRTVDEALQSGAPAAGHAWGGAR